MSTNPRYNNGALRERVRRKLSERGDVCALCGRPIDYSLPHWVTLPDGTRTVHPASFVVDEIVPVSLGGSPVNLLNCQSAHYACNASRGKHSMDWVRGVGQPQIANALPVALNRLQYRSNKINSTNSYTASKKHIVTSQDW